jgi:hypothetical protein
MDAWARLSAADQCSVDFRNISIYLFIVAFPLKPMRAINFGVKLFRVPVINKTPPKMLLFYFLYYQILMRSNERPINAELERIY